MHSKVKKKSGMVEPFSVKKLQQSIKKAMKEAEFRDQSLRITKEVVEQIKGKTITSVAIEELVEQSLLKNRMNTVLKAYIGQASQHTFSGHLFKKDKLSLSEEALALLHKKYLKKEESPSQFFSALSKKIGGKEKARAHYALLSSLDFVPSSRIMKNFKNRKGMCSCSSLDVPSQRHVVPPSFMHAVIHNHSVSYLHAQGRKERLKARELFDFVCTESLDEGNSQMHFSSTKGKGDFFLPTITGELHAIPTHPCCTGTINLSHMVKNNHVNWLQLGKTIDAALAFLSDVLAVTPYPSSSVKKSCHASLGLGFMGWAEMLIALHIPYESRQAKVLAQEVMQFVSQRAKGAVISFEDSSEASVIASCSQGVQPLHAIAHAKQLAKGIEKQDVHEGFASIARYQGFYTPAIMKQVFAQGHVQGVEGVPQDIQALFRSSLDLPMEAYITMHAVFQKETKGSVPTTIMLDHTAKLGDVKRAYMLAWKSGCKDVQVVKRDQKVAQKIHRGKNIIHTVKLRN